MSLVCRLVSTALFPMRSKAFRRLSMYDGWLSMVGMLFLVMVLFSAASMTRDGK